MAKITNGHSPYIEDSRYRYDERVCSAAKGWAQLDSSQDASYYGQWVNPITLEIFCYCEGDLSHTECESEADFIAELTRTIEWNKAGGYWKGIDPGWPDTASCDRIRSAFIVLGFRDALH